MKTAILGCAHMHVYSYLDSIRRLDIDVVGITDSNPDEGAAFAEKTGLRFYADTEELLSLKPDFVIICSDNIGHKPYTLAAAHKGIHVIVEKPIATTLSDSDEMIECCKQNNVKLMVCFPVRYSTPMREAKKAIESGKIGNIMSIVATNHGSMPGGWFVDKERSGGGAVIDHTVHVADIMHWIMGSDVKSVDAVIERLIHPIKTEDCGLLLLEFENSVIASIDTCWNRPKSFPTWGDVVMDFVGDAGSMHVDGFSEHSTVFSDKATKAVYVPFGNDMDFEMIADFVDAIKNDRPSPVSGEDGRFALKVALMAYESAR